MNKRRPYHLIVYALCCLLLMYHSNAPFVYAEDLLVNFFELYSADKLPDHVSSKTTKQEQKSTKPAKETQKKSTSTRSSTDQQTVNSAQTTETNEYDNNVNDTQAAPDENTTPTIPNDTSQDTKNIGMQDIDKETLVGPSGNPIFSQEHGAADTEQQDTEEEKQPLEELYEGLIGPSGNPIETAKADISVSDELAVPEDGVSEPQGPSDTVDLFVTDEQIDLELPSDYTSTLLPIDTVSDQMTVGPTVQANALDVIVVDENIGEHIVIIPEDTTIKTSKSKKVKKKKLDIWHPSEAKTDLFNEPILETVAFGIPDTHLIFSKPVEVNLFMGSEMDGQEVRIYVLHSGDEKYTDRSLTTDPDATCLSDGTTPLPQNTTIVQQGYARMYACGASTFVVTYNGGATPENFVDNDTITKVISVTTGNTHAQSLIEKLTVTVDFRAIDGVTPSLPGSGSSSASEFSMKLTSPSGTTKTLLIATAYTNDITPRATVIFDDTASTQPSGTPTSGTFLPFNPLADFNGERAIGNRILTLTDNAYDDGVILYSASLSFTDTDCGDGVIEAAETCDDGNALNNDGCNSACVTEAGRSCTGQPSSCTQISTTAGLRVRLDGSNSGSRFNDVSGNGIHGTGFNSVTTGTTNGETVMCFNGTTQYIEINTGVVSNYPFSMSAWMKSDNINSNRGLISMARSTSASILYNLEHNLATMRTRAQNTTARYATSPSLITTSNRFLVTAVFSSSTSRQIYVNGILQGSNTASAAFDTNTARRRNIGRFADSTPSNYFDGCLDDIRIYNIALSAAQVYSLYARPATISTAVVTTASPMLTGTIHPLDTISLVIAGNTYTGTNNNDGTRTLPQNTISPGLANGVYPITFTVTTPYSSAVSYSGSLNVTLTNTLTGDVSISAPTTFILSGAAQTSSTIQTIEQTSSSSFIVSDMLGSNNGYYTTLNISNLSGTYQSIAKSNLERKANGVTTLSGTANANVRIGSGRNAYAPATGTVTFIKRDPGSNNGIKGTYGSLLHIRLTIPAYTRPDTYQGTLTFTLYEN